MPLRCADPPMLMRSLMQALQNAEAFCMHMMIGVRELSARAAPN